MNEADDARRWRQRHPLTYLEANRRSRERRAQETPAVFLHCQTRTRAKRKGIRYSLTEEWIAERLTQCEVTGLPFDFRMGTAKRRNPWRPSIDRIDSRKGYHPDNCRIVVWIYNMARGSGTDDDVRRMATALLKV